MNSMGRKIDADDLIDSQGVADLLELSHRNSVNLYQRRYTDMPQPVIDLGGGRVRLWLRSEIERWGAERASDGRTRPGRRVTR
jgi:predicted DNA-binding transcriptional regulator AlpA